MIRAQIGRFTRLLGRVVIVVIEQTGAIFLLLGKIIGGSAYLWRDRHLLLDQMLLIGVNSVPLVAIIAVFTGAVSAWQAAYQFRGLISLNYLGSATSLAIFIELGPVLTGVILAGRVGSSIAAELGTMKVTEQIDALESLAIDPVRYLAVPRFCAAIIMTPVLTIFANFIALMGAFLVTNILIGQSARIFFDSVQSSFEIRNVMGGLTKAFVFGATIAVVGCYVGFQTSGGAEGVGRATIRAFVLSAAVILMHDYALATIIF
ncbi:MAG: ABC transporter permease [candidate division KSB1 bacterium]|nr:ABC transporter permease [candidate division KSB1 bacterium]MDZ7303497.1 ABC transporter permease [candidate division KSB1 bacterium]MDZ7312701.1 ABC transporter permease [candidate division KSB1 bacterium]